MANKSSDSQKTTLEAKRHSLAHLLPMAMHELFPGSKACVGPVIENGFYYDIDFQEPISEDDFPKIEEKMRELIEQNIDFTYSEKPIKDAIAKYDEEGNEFKRETVEGLAAEGEEKVSFYTSGDFEDLCKGPHVNNTSEINPDAFQLDRIAGAYWHGDENEKMLTRIYGLAFETKKELRQHLAMREEAKKRDHRKIGKEMELFRISPKVGPGLPIILKNGMVLWRRMEDYLGKMMREHYKDDFNKVHALHTPHIGSQALYETSGHWEKYKVDNFPPMEVEGRSYMLKPMNCPHHIEAFTNKPLSYRDLPYRTFEVGTVYRREQSGELSGLSRVRKISQDDGHIFLADDPKELEREIVTLLDIVLEMFEQFGFEDYRVMLSTHDSKDFSKYVGDPETWERAEGTLTEILEKQKDRFPGKSYDTVPGEAAFYGPKIDLIAKDAIGREWQLSTIQLDYNLPERFELTYVGEDGKDHQPIMLHRAIFGAVERFLAVYIEHTGGVFPTWIAPLQVMLLPVGEQYHEFAKEVASKLFEAGVRVEVDDSNESVGKKIRNSARLKPPYTVVLGEKEQSSGNLPIRARGSKDVEEMTLDKFLAKLAQEDDHIRIS